MASVFLETCRHWTTIPSQERASLAQTTASVVGQTRRIRSRACFVGSAGLGMERAPGEEPEHPVVP